MDAGCTKLRALTPQTGIRSGLDKKKKKKHKTCYLRFGNGFGLGLNDNKVNTLCVMLQVPLDFLNRQLSFPNHNQAL